MTPTTIRELQEYAQAGALDADSDSKAPHGWPWRIDLENTLIMIDPARCACCMIYGNYEAYRGSNAHATDLWFMQHGYYVPKEDPERRAKYMVLKNAWRTEAHNRRLLDIKNGTVPEQYQHLIELALAMEKKTA